MFKIENREFCTYCVQLIRPWEKVDRDYNENSHPVHVKCLREYKGIDEDIGLDIRRKI